MRYVSSLLIVCLLVGFSSAQKPAKNVEIVAPRSYKQPAIEDSAKLQTILNTVVGEGRGFSGKLLSHRKMTDAKLWSKAGWTSTTRHDAAYIETADGLKFVIVVFT